MDVCVFWNAQRFSTASKQHSRHPPCPSRILLPFLARLFCSLLVTPFSCRSIEGTGSTNHRCQLTSHLNLTQERLTSYVPNVTASTAFSALDHIQTQARGWAHGDPVLSALVSYAVPIIRTSTDASGSPAKTTRQNAEIAWPTTGQPGRRNRSAPESRRITSAAPLPESQPIPGHAALSCGSTRPRSVQRDAFATNTAAPPMKHGKHLTTTGHGQRESLMVHREAWSIDRILPPAPTYISCAVSKCS